jgi:hypothetical protein
MTAPSAEPVLTRLEARGMEIERARQRQARFLVLVMRHAGLCVKSRSTEIDLIEPPQRHHFSSTWRRLRVLMKRW